ncbi:MAG: DNA polymerase III subunit alpha, partial [Chloroflexi bacterium]|nr:DNA polymerase III subunit alpha [Chloroflexota bacterium]
ELNISLDRAVETSPALRELMAGDDRVDKLIGIAKQLEGVSRHASTHAAGIVISRDPLTEIMPLQRATDGRTTMTQFEMHACEALGLLKFDFLGLINLTILADAVELVRTHRSIELDVDKLPLDDRKTFDLLSTGETTGVFQLEGSGMRRYVKELKPTEVRDLAVMVALFRPGPMANIPAYIRRKHGEEAVTYLHDSLEPALRDTYGIFVYQEDIMTAAIAMADYTGPEADNLCYAIRKKKESVLRQHEAKFKAGAKKKGIPPQIVDRVFAEFEPFARYGFNKAHATCYGLIAYQTAYLKANYPIEFMTAVMNGFSGRAEKVAAVIAECRRLGIEVRPPDVQKSSAPFTVETDAAGVPEAIRFGMAAIKNVGEGAIEAITTVRDGGEEPGPFRSLTDLCQRVDLRTVNKRVMESLIKANAVASLGTASALLGALDGALENGQRHQRDVAAGQSTLFDLFVPTAGDGSVQFLDGGDEIPRRERLRWEKELIGLYLSEHPLGDIAGELPDYVTAYTGDLAEEAEAAKVTLGGILISSRRVVTRAGSTMLVATLEDLQGSVEVVVFPKVFEQTANSWADDSIVLITGRIDRRDDSPQILCEAVHAWDEAVRMGSVAFGVERDRLLAVRGGGRRWDKPPERAQGVWSGGDRQPIPVQPLPATAVAVAEPEAVAAAIGGPEPAEETAAPVDAVPIQSTPIGVAATVSVSFGEDVSMEHLLGAIESVKGALSGRPGPLPVLLSISVAGATRQVRLPDHVAWDERLGEVLRRAAGVPVAVELRPGAEERLA